MKMLVPGTASPLLGIAFALRKPAVRPSVEKVCDPADEDIEFYNEFMRRTESEEYRLSHTGKVKKK